MLELSLSKCLVKPFFFILLSLGAIIGVSCLIIVLSLFQNYYLASESVFMGIHPHVEININGMDLKEAQNIIERLKKAFPQIESISPALYDQIKLEISEVETIKAFCVNENGQSICKDDSVDPSQYVASDISTKYGFNILKKEIKTFFLKGISIIDNQTVMKIKRIVEGNRNLDRLKLTRDSMGNFVPMGFFMEPSATSRVTPNTNFLLSFPNINDKKNFFRLTGNLRMGRKKGEIPLLIMSLENAQKVMQTGRLVNTIELNVKKPYESEKIASKIRKMIDEEYKVTSWTQKEKAAFKFLRTIKVMIFAIIFNISIVAAIGVFSTLMLSVMESKKKIAIFKALGMKNKTIYKIFIASSIVICMIGLGFGSFFGYSAIYFLIKYFSMSLQKLGIEHPQIFISYLDIVLISFFSFVIFVATALIPAQKALNVDPVENLHG